MGSVSWNSVRGLGVPWVQRLLKQCRSPEPPLNPNLMASRSSPSICEVCDTILLWFIQMVKDKCCGCPRGCSGPQTEQDKEAGQRVALFPKHFIKLGT